MAGLSHHDGVIVALKLDLGTSPDTERVTDLLRDGDLTFLRYLHSKNPVRSTHTLSIKTLILRRQVERPAITDDDRTLRGAMTPSTNHAGFETPKRIIAVDGFPETVGGKILKYKLQETLRQAPSATHVLLAERAATGILPDVLAAEEVDWSSGL